MPWKETCRMEERLKFVAAWLAGAVDPGLVRGLRPASRA